MGIKIVQVILPFIPLQAPRIAVREFKWITTKNIKAKTSWTLVSRTIFNYGSPMHMLYMDCKYFILIFLCDIHGIIKTWQFIFVSFKRLQ
jgi:hypothetical protein